jgi:enoyl-[acyl-carrier protein] reductase/trans-2-enoyl-CoA reductase (NAD+)
LKTPTAEGSPGWLILLLLKKKHKKGLYAKSVNGDAFSDEIKKRNVSTIKADLGQVDLIIYSLAPVRKHPVTGVCIVLC